MGGNEEYDDRGFVGSFTTFEETKKTNIFDPERKSRNGNICMFIFCLVRRIAIRWTPAAWTRSSADGQGFVEPPNGSERLPGGGDTPRRK